MWLASISLLHRVTRTSVFAKEWTTQQRARADQIIDSMLAGVGDPERERSFSMCLTHCRHRAITDDELARLPAEFRCGAPRSLAGGPLVVHWTRGIDHVLSADPCDHVVLVPHPTLGVPLPSDCGACPPCRARQIVENTGAPCTLTRSTIGHASATG